MTTIHDFDATVLAGFEKLGGVELAQRMLALFLQYTPQRLAAAREGFESGDMEAVGRAVHSLKSTAGHLRATRIQELATIIEQLVIAEQHEAIAEPLDALEAAYARVAPVLEQHRSALEA